MQWILNKEDGYGELPEDKNFWENGIFDGHYVYFGLNEIKTLVRFNTREKWNPSADAGGMGQKLTGFRDRTSWDTVELGTILGRSLPEHGPYYPSLTTDGKWIYYAPDSTSSGSGSPDGTTLLRFDANKDFLSASSWQKIGLENIVKSETGWKHRSFRGLMFDGKWIYYAPDKSDFFVRYNIDKYFPDNTAWETFAVEKLNLNTDRFFKDVTYDGEYLYFVPAGSQSILKFSGLPCKGKFGMGR